jgi:hypothetical protein
MSCDEIVLARAAVSALREALHSNPHLVMAGDSVEVRCAGGLAVLLLTMHVDASELASRLQSMERFLVDRQVKLELENVDWNVLLTEG